MKDPYETLGVSPSASDDDIKKAYRELARKYHPDNYHDNPLSDLAQEKMKQINEAYDTITRQRGSGGGARSAGRSRGTEGTGPYAAIRAAINAGELSRAEMLLGSITDRGAEWNFLMGSLCYRRGWMDEAARYFELAASMNPTNPEYQQALAYMRGGGMAYRPYGTVQHGVDPCNLCSGLCIADCCCEAMGGDLIFCC